MGSAKKTEKGRFRAFLERKNIDITAKAYFLDAMSAMALGLFSSLLIGTIFGTIYTWTNWEFMNTVATYAKGAVGAALGVSIAYALKAPPFVLFSCAPTTVIAPLSTTSPVSASTSSIAYVSPSDIFAGMSTVTSAVVCPAAHTTSFVFTEPAIVTFTVLVQTDACAVVFVRESGIDTDLVRPTSACSPTPPSEGTASSPPL